MIVGIDPRDAIWEAEASAFRVYFRDESNVQDEYELTDVPLRDVLSWAEAERAGRSYRVMAVVEAGGRGVVTITEARSA